MQGAGAEVLLTAERLGLITGERVPAARAALAGLPSADRASCLNQLVGAGFLDPAQAIAVRSELESGRTMATRPTAPPSSTPLDSRYVIGDPLGRGGMGQVVSATDPDLGREVAIKTIHDADDPEVRQRFVEEARVTGRLEHPNIVPVHELGIDANGKPFLVMKRVRGASLAEVLRRPPASPERELLRLLGVFVKACEAVSFAHSRGVLHRDLKPENIMVGEFGEVLVMDWGLAKAKARGGPVSATDSATVTMDGEVLGTPAYMAPEQAAGEIAKLGPRTDVYGLGAVLYEILAGARPYQADTVQELLVKVVRGELVPPTARAKAAWPVPRELEAVVLKAMAREARDRYATVEALKDEIDRYLTGGRVGAAEYSSWELLAKWAKRNKTAVATGSIAAALLVAATVVFVINLNRARMDALTQKGAAERSAAEASASAKAAEESRGEAEFRLAESAIHHGDALLSAGRPTEALEKYEQARAELRRLGRSTERADLGIFDVHRRYPPPLVEIGDLPAPAGHVRFLADGRRFVSGHSNGILIVWDGWTGQKLRTMEGKAGVQSIAPAGDGRMLTAHDDKTVRLWRVETGEMLREYPIGSAVQPVAWFPDGRRFATGGEGGIVLVIDMESGRAIARLKGNPWQLAGIAVCPDGRRLVSGGTDKCLRFWDLSTGSEYAPPVRLDGYVTDIHLAGESRVTAIAGGVLAVVDTTTGKQEVRAAGHTGSLVSGGLTRNGLRIVTAGWDRTIVVHDGRTGAKRSVLASLGDAFHHLAISPRGDTVVTSDRSNRLRVWSLEEPDVLRGHTSGARSLAFSADGRTLVTASGDFRIKTWDLETRSVVHSAMLPSRAWDAAFLPDGDLLVGVEDGRLLVWNLAEGVVKTEIRTPSRMVTACAVLPDGRVLAGGQDGVLRVYELASRRLVSEIKVHGAWMARIDVIGDGRQVVTAGADGRCVRVDVDAGREMVAYEGHESLALGIRMSRDLRRVASAGHDQFVRVSDAATGKLLHRLRGHSGTVQDVDLSADGTRVLSSGSDGTVRLWDAATGREVRVFEVGQFLDRVRFLPGGAGFLAACGDGSIRIFDVARRGVDSKPPADPAERLASAGATMPAIDLLGSGELRVACLMRAGRFEEAAEAGSVHALRAAWLPKLIEWRRMFANDERAAPALTAGPFEIEDGRPSVRRVVLGEGGRATVTAVSDDGPVFVRVFMADGTWSTAASEKGAPAAMAFKAPFDGTFLVVVGPGRAGQEGIIRVSVDFE